MKNINCDFTYVYIRYVYNAYQPHFLIFYRFKLAHKKNRSTEGCSKPKRSVDMTSKIEVPRDVRDSKGP